MVAGIYQVVRVAIEMHMLQSSHADNIWICFMESTSRANMLLYDVPYELRKDVPDCIQCILTPRKYLRVSKDAQ